ncbi:MAG: glycosyltransferase [Pseudomonadota bacterium]
MADDKRVKLTTPPPPTTLAGKMNACAHLGAEATGDVLLFIDADVTLAPDAARRIADHMAANDFALVSGFPRQVTETWWEKVLIPLIYAVLMGYLPLIGMKFTRFAMFAQGCGQLMAVTGGSYRAMGGHAVMENRLHDGVVMPGKWRKAGYGTDLIDATPLADCRM